MSDITRVGVDLAKNVIQVHAVNAQDKLVTNRALSRDKFMSWCVHLQAGCIIAMEACSSAHHWARKLVTMGFEVRIIPAQFVAPYRLQGKGGKNDANDAAAVCEAASRPNMHFVPIKSIDQQGVLTVHRLREGFKHQLIASTNRIRGLLAEFGVILPQSLEAMHEHLSTALEDAENEISAVARLALDEAWDQCLDLEKRLAWCDERIAAHVKNSHQASKAKQLIGIGPITASAAVATVVDFKQFKNGAQFGAWLGLTPRQHSSGGKTKLGGITKRGDVYLRTLFIQAAKSAVMTAHKRDDPISQWLTRLRDTSGWQKACVAMANKNARILWAIMTKDTVFDAKHVSVKPGGASHTEQPIQSEKVVAA
jgi:transposase